jgi:hypothetical protein
MVFNHIYFNFTKSEEESQEFEREGEEGGRRKVI